MPKIITGELTGPDWDHLVKEVAQQIYDAQLKGPISEDMVTRMAKELMKGLSAPANDDSGSVVDPNAEEISAELLQTIEKNIYVFAGFKNYWQLQECAELLKGAKNFEEFFTGVQAIDKTYNKVYARAEYNTVTNGAWNVRRFERYRAVKDIVPNVIFTTSGGPNVCDTCNALSGTVAAIDSEFVATHGVPVHFGECACAWLQAMDSETLTPDEDLPQPVYPKGSEGFKHNCAFDGQLLPEKASTYFKGVPKDVAKQIRKDSTGLIDSD